MTKKTRDKKLVWVINQFAGNLDSGWGERHFYFSRHWLNAGYDVRIISGSFNHMFRNTKQVVGLCEIEVSDGVDFVWVKTPTYNPTSWRRFYSMLVFSYRILRVRVSEIGKPDIVLVSSMPIFPVASALLLRLRYNFKLIFEIRDIWPLTLQFLGKKSKWNPAVLFIGFFEWIGYKYADAIVSLLPNARQHMEDIARKKLNYHYIPNGSENIEDAHIKLPLEIVRQIPLGKFIVGYAGTIGLANALEYLIEASELLKGNDDIVFVFAGDGYLKSELIDRCKENRNVIFLPKLPKSQMPALINRFSICFVGRNGSPLYDHGVSANKYFDYMLACKPILASNNLIKDPVELSGCGVVVKPDSGVSIRDGILQLYNMPETERQHLGALGFSFLKQHHDIPILAGRYISLFKDLTSA